ncbi:MAG: diacylglycerol kinase [Granulosicoccaceae bacterium]|jgi:diacylglycerol kinase (ATP)
MTEPVIKTTSKHPLKRLWHATGYSLQGLSAAFKNEQAFRLETYLLVIVVPLAFYLTDNNFERAIMIACWLVVMMAELVNSAIEATIDRFGGEHHELSGRAKDIGSALVFVALLMFFLVWTLILY